MSDTSWKMLDRIEWKQSLSYKVGGLSLRTCHCALYEQLGKVS